MMKFRLIFSALAIIVAIGAYMLKGNTESGSSEAVQQSQPQATQQSAPAPQPSNDNGMSGFSINNRN
jgi:hypothetical protein